MILSYLLNVVGRNGLSVRSDRAFVKDIKACIKGLVKKNRGGRLTTSAVARFGVVFSDRPSLLLPHLARCEMTSRGGVRRDL